MKIGFGTFAALFIFAAMVFPFSAFFIFFFALCTLPVWLPLVWLTQGIKASIERRRISYY